MIKSRFVAGLAFVSALGVAGAALAQAEAGAGLRVAAPPAGKGQIVFYRRSDITGAWTSFTIREGDKDVGKLKNGSYFVDVVEPGPHTFVLHNLARKQITVDVQPGQTYYVQQYILLASAPIATYQWILQPGSKAAFDSAKLKLVVGGAAE